jgi:hypothetical protein
MAIVKKYPENSLRPQRKQMFMGIVLESANFEITDLAITENASIGCKVHALFYLCWASFVF